MKKQILIFLMLCVSSNFSYGQGFYVKGIADCGLWHQARSNGGSSSLEHSIQGFINGAAMATKIEIWHGNGVDTSPQSAYLYIDNYCKSHPLEDIWQASYAFINEKTNNAFFTSNQKRTK